MGDKLYILLDIDDTLLKNTKNTLLPSLPNLDKFETAPNLKNSTFVLRPHIREFMDYLFANHYVSIWTWSDYAYAMCVANLLSNGDPSKFKDILSEEDADISATLHKVGGKDLNYLWYDYNEKYIKPETRKKLDDRNANISKFNANRDEEGLELYAPKKVPFTGYAPCNTILIDDAAYNVNNSNKFNLIQIKAFGGHTETASTKGSVPVFDEADDEFPKIIKYLEELKAKKACEKDEELHIMKAGRRTRRHKRHFKKTRKVKKLKRARRS
jgi:hypothetical protein